MWVEWQVGRVLDDAKPSLAYMYLVSLSFRLESGKKSSLLDYPFILDPTSKVGHKQSSSFTENTSFNAGINL